VSGNWYLSVYESGDSFLYVGDITTGVFAPVGLITLNLIIDLAIDSQGNAYGHDISSDQLISIDLVTGQGTAIGPTGYNANWAQGMDFDYANDYLYATIYTINETSVFAVFDLLTGQATAIQDTTPMGDMEMVVANPLGMPARSGQSTTWAPPRPGERRYVHGDQPHQSGLLQHDRPQGIRSGGSSGLDADEVGSLGGTSASTPGRASLRTPSTPAKRRSTGP
jgi:hypothetical protein